MDGLVVAEREVAPMSNPDEDVSLIKRRTFKPRGVVSERKSRRYFCNCSDGFLPKKSTVVVSNSRAFNSLMIKGGCGGRQRINFPQTKEWNYFPNDNKYKTTYNMLLPVHEREKRNENTFTSVNVNTCKATKVDSVNKREMKEKGTHRICNLNKFEVYLNDKLICKCHVNDVVDEIYSTLLYFG